MDKVIKLIDDICDEQGLDKLENVVIFKKLEEITHFKIKYIALGN